MTNEQQIWAEAVCRKSGVAVFIGPFLGGEYLLFSSIKSGSSLALKAENFSVESVVAHTLANDALFEAQRQA